MTEHAKFLTELHFLRYLYDKKGSIITKMNLGEKGDFESKSAIKNVIIQIDD